MNYDMNALLNFNKHREPESWRMDVEDSLFIAYQAVGAVECEEVSYGREPDRALATLGSAYARLLAQATAQAEELARLRAALSPSEKTKYAYNGEFSFQQEILGDDGEHVPVDIVVPWTTIKDIMAAIQRHADAQAGA